MTDQTTNYIIEILSPSNNRSTLHTAHTIFTVGKSLKSDLRIMLPSVQPEHLRINLKEQSFEVFNDFVVLYRVNKEKTTSSAQNELINNESNIKDEKSSIHENMPSINQDNSSDIQNQKIPDNKFKYFENNTLQPERQRNGSFNFGDIFDIRGTLIKIFEDVKKNNNTIDVEEAIESTATTDKFMLKSDIVLKKTIELTNEEERRHNAEHFDGNIIDTGSVDTINPETMKKRLDDHGSADTMDVLNVEKSYLENKIEQDSGQKEALSNILIEEEKITKKGFEIEMPASEVENIIKEEIIADVGRDIKENVELKLAEKMENEIKKELQEEIKKELLQNVTGQINELIKEVVEDVKSEVIENMKDEQQNETTPITTEEISVLEQKIEEKIQDDIKDHLHQDIKEEVQDVVTSEGVKMMLNEKIDEIHENDKDIKNTHDEKPIEMKNTEIETETKIKTKRKSKNTLEKDTVKTDLNEDDHHRKEVILDITDRQNEEVSKSEKPNVDELNTINIEKNKQLDNIKTQEKISKEQAEKKDVKTKRKKITDEIQNDNSKKKQPLKIESIIPEKDENRPDLRKIKEKAKEHIKSSTNKGKETKKDKIVPKKEIKNDKIVKKTEQKVSDKIDKKRQPGTKIKKEKDAQSIKRAKKITEKEKTPAKKVNNIQTRKDKKGLVTSKESSTLESSDSGDTMSSETVQVKKTQPKKVSASPNKRMSKSVGTKNDRNVSKKGSGKKKNTRTKK